MPEITVDLEENPASFSAGALVMAGLGCAAVLVLPPYHAAVAIGIAAGLVAIICRFREELLIRAKAERLVAERTAGTQASPPPRQ